MRWLRLPRLRRRRTYGLSQLLLAGAVMVGGAWLISTVMVGVVIMVSGLLIGLDALFRDNAKARQAHVAGTHEAVIERFRQAK